MKKVYIALPVLILLILLLFTNDLYVKEISEDFIKIAKNIQEDIEYNKYDQAKENIIKLHKYWHKYETYMQVVVNHSDWENVYVMVEKISSFYENGEYHLLDAHIKELIANVEHLYESERLSFQNVL